MCGAGAADDIVQDTFLAVLGQGHRRDAIRGSARPYLIGIARHLVFKRLAAQTAVTFVDDAGDAVFDRADLADDAVSALDGLSQAETIAEVRAAIVTLPPVYREAIVLCELHELDYESAARAMECPVGTVRSRLHRGRALLRQALEERRATPADGAGI